MLLLKTPRTNTSISLPQGVFQQTQASHKALPSSPTDKKLGVHPRIVRDCGDSWK